VAGQFVPFDVSSFTFGVGPYAPNGAVNNGAVTLMNAGLLAGGTGTMPQNTLLPLITYLKNNGNFTPPTGGPPAAAAPGNVFNPPNSWGADANSVYNTTYAVSCRACHVTQGGNNWTKLNSFLTALGKLPVAGGPVNIATGKPMPHTQRTWGIFWGSATGLQLQDLNTITGTPAVISQPLQAGTAANNAAYFP
jgi:hypothetical protein